MRVAAIIAVVVTLMHGAPAGALDGTLVTGSFHSATLGGEIKSYQIYLPPGYEAATESYPVVYRLGWHFDDASELVEVVDDMIVAGLVEPIILVKPCGRPSPPQMGRWMEFPDNTYMPNYMDSEVMGSHLSYLVDDVVAHIDASYRTLADRDHRSVCGGSGGSQWAMRPALLHPETFGSVVGVASVLDWRGFEGLCGAVANDQDYRPIEDYVPTSDNLTGDLLSVAGHYLPNPNNPPWYVNYPCHQNGQHIPALWALIDSKTARGVAELLWVPDLDLRIGIFAASDDQFGAADSARRFADVLDAQQAAHTLRIYESGQPDPHDDYRPGMMISYLHPMKATAWVRPTRLWSSVPLDTVSVRLEPHESLDLNEVDLDSIVVSAIDGSELYEPIDATVGIVDDALEAELAWSALMAAIDRTGVENGATVELTIRGEMTDGRFFAGIDAVRYNGPYSQLASPPSD
jgi:S-formylglutathione hydrolase FrmB